MHKYVFICFMVGLLTGCSSMTHAYKGAEVEESKLGVIWSPALQFVEVNGKKIRSIYVKKVFVKPGSNKTVVKTNTSVDPLTNKMTIYTWTLDLNIEAGHTYYLFSNRKHGTYWDKNNGLLARDLGLNYTIPDQPFFSNQDYEDKLEQAKTQGEPAQIATN